MTSVRRWLAAAWLVSASVPAGAGAVMSSPPAAVAQVAVGALPAIAVPSAALAEAAAQAVVVAPPETTTQAAAAAAPASEARRAIRAPEETKETEETEETKASEANEAHQTTAVNSASEPVPSAAPPLLIVDVHLIRMHDDRVEPALAVLVRDGRIAAIGRRTDLAVPANAIVIDGAGRHLLPGLTDAHVHLTTDMPWAPARPDFGDAPLYLAHGVTTVVNLRGTPEQLDWRRRIEAGTLLAPTIYSSGEFVNEPRVRTPEEVAREISAQQQAG